MPSRLQERENSVVRLPPAFQGPGPGRPRPRSVSWRTFAPDWCAERRPASLSEADIRARPWREPDAVPRGDLNCPTKAVEILPQSGLFVSRIPLPVAAGIHHRPQGAPSPTLLLAAVLATTSQILILQSICQRHARRTRPMTATPFHQAESIFPCNTPMSPISGSGP